MVLPGAAPAAPQGATSPPAKHRSRARREGAGPGGKGARASRRVSRPAIASVAGRPLMLNGKSGFCRFPATTRRLTIDKLQLAGESVSDPSQRCVVDIVGEKPI